MKRPAAALMSIAGLSALSAGLASLALFGLAIGLMLLAITAWGGLALSAHRVSVGRLLSTSEIEENAPIHVRFAVSRARWLPVRVEVEDHVGGWAEVKGSGASLELRVSRPGAYWLAPSRIRLRDALGLFERRTFAGPVDPLLILPAPTGWTRVGPTRWGLSDDPEPEGLRPYTPGTPLTRVHWPALARGAGLHVRHFAPPPGGLPLVVVDTAGARNPGALDWTARTAAGYVLTLARTGGCRVLLPGDTNATSVVGLGGAWRAVHRRLATLGDLPADNTPPRAEHTATLRVRASTAPALLTAPPQLPRGLLAHA
jgi:uncharacterized protein (DUF58 family)